MKKIVALVLALVMVLSLGTVAFAAEYDPFRDAVYGTYRFMGEVNKGMKELASATTAFMGEAAEKAMQGMGLLAFIAKENDPNKAYKDRYDEVMKERWNPFLADYEAKGAYVKKWDDNMGFFGNVIGQLSAIPSAITSMLLKGAGIISGGISDDLGDIDVGKMVNRTGSFFGFIMGRVASFTDLVQRNVDENYGTPGEIPTMPDMSDTKYWNMELATPTFLKDVYDEDYAAYTNWNNAKKAADTIGGVVANLIGIKREAAMDKTLKFGNWLKNNLSGDFFGLGSDLHEASGGMFRLAKYTRDLVDSAIMDLFSFRGFPYYHGKS